MFTFVVYLRFHLLLLKRLFGLRDWRTSSSLLGMASPPMVLAIVIFSKGIGDRILWELFWVHVRTWLRLAQPEDGLGTLNVFFWYLSGLLATLPVFSSSPGLELDENPFGRVSGFLISVESMRDRSMGCSGVLTCYQVDLQDHTLWYCSS